MEVAIHHWLHEHLMQFKLLEHMPVDIDINRLDDGYGIEATLMRHQLACWHKTCLVVDTIDIDRHH